MGGELVALDAERIVATLGVPALVMGLVVTPAARPDERLFSHTDEKEKLEPLPATPRSTPACATRYSYH